MFDVHSLVDSSQYPCKAGTFIPLLYLRKLRLREVGEFGQDHMVNEEKAGISIHLIPTPEPLLHMDYSACNIWACLRSLEDRFPWWELVGTQPVQAK